MLTNALSMSQVASTQKAQNWGAGTEGDKGTGTVIRDGHPYTVQVAHVKDEKGTFHLLSTVCVVVLFKKMVKRKFFYCK